MVQPVTPGVSAEVLGLFFFFLFLLCLSVVRLCAADYREESQLRATILAWLCVIT